MRRSHDLRPVEEANMAPAVPCRYHLRTALIAVFLGAVLLLAQDEAQKAGFYDVSLSKDDIYTYSSLKFAGDYTSWESSSGLVALGRTEAGVTVLIVIG